VSTIAFLGLGAMGSRMARRLMEGGHDLIVWNRTASKADRLVELGAVRAKSPAQAVRAAPTIITMLSDPQALRDVVGGPDGIASGVHADATMIEMSTVGPAAISRLRSSLPDHVSLLDAPVLGSLSEAESGSLTIFVGGSPALVERWTSLLSTLGTLVPVGELGMGAAAKLLANAALFGGASDARRGPRLRERPRPSAFHRVFGP